MNIVCTNSKYQASAVCSHCDTFSEELSERGGSKFSFHHDSNFSAQKDIGGGKRTHF